jgi:hypothetical protein
VVQWSAEIYPRLENIQALLKIGKNERRPMVVLALTGYYMRFTELSKKIGVNCLKKLCITY